MSNRKKIAAISPAPGFAVFLVLVSFDLTVFSVSSRRIDTGQVSVTMDPCPTNPG
jgi:hypothetical protein